MNKYSSLLLTLRRVIVLFVVILAVAPAASADATPTGELVRLFVPAGYVAGEPHTLIVVTDVSPSTATCGGTAAYDVVIVRQGVGVFQTQVHLRVGSPLSAGTRITPTAVIVHECLGDDGVVYDEVVGLAY